MYVSLSRKYVLCQFIGKNGHNFNKYSIKLLNEALIGKMSRNKSWSNLKLSYEYVYIKNVHMFVSPKMVFFVHFCNFLQNCEAIYEFRPIQKKRFFLDMDIGSYHTCRYSTRALGLFKWATSKKIVASWILHIVCIRSIEPKNPKTLKKKVEAFF